MLIASNFYQITFRYLSLVSYCLILMLCVQFKSRINQFLDLICLRLFHLMCVHVVELRGKKLVSMLLQLLEP